MTINPHVQEILDDAVALRHDLHMHPEMGFKETRTASIAAGKLRECGCDEVIEGVGRTGVVALIRGRRPGIASVGFRADMDALPLVEKTGAPWTSQVLNCMHGCGHDGHVAWLYATAYALCRERDFPGQAVLVVQPGEEGFAGGREMIKDGLFRRFPVDEIYAGHGAADIPLGRFGITKGAMMAAADRFTIRVRGVGGHGARPQQCVDPVVAAAEVITAMQTIASRASDPMRPVVVTIASIHGGDEDGVSVIPDEVRLAGTTRCMHPEDRDMIERRMNGICSGVAAGTGTRIELNYIRMYPALINHDEQRLAAADAVRETAGDDALDLNYPASMGAEDFAFMLCEKPGAYIRVGMRDAKHTALAHNPGFDFNDLCIGPAATMFVRLIKDRLNYLEAKRR